MLFYQLIKITFIFKFVYCFPSILNKNMVVGQLKYLIKSGTNIPILLDGNSEFKHFKYDVLEHISSLEKKEFIQTSYSNFIKCVPHLQKKDSVIYVPDFLICNGRIFNEYEIQFMKNLNLNSNIIILGSDNLNKITFKDGDMNKCFNIITFPNIRRVHLISHIKTIVIKNNYDPYLITLPWNSVPLEKLNLELINILLFELDMVRSKYSSSSFTLKNLISDVNDLKKTHEIMNDFLDI